MFEADCEQRLLSPDGLDGDRVELLVRLPAAGVPPRPAVLLMHGFQRPPRSGARWLLEKGYFELITALGYVAAAISMIGYGASDGQPDFCGPRSQLAVRAGLAALRSMPGVAADRIALCGWSRGAMVSALAAAGEPDLHALVLVSGAYDLRDESKFLVDAIRVTYLEEAGPSQEAADARSAIVHAHRIRTPTLILHGGDDERASVGDAQALHRRMLAAGCPVTLETFPGVGHSVPSSLIWPKIQPFLEATLGA